MVPSNDITRYGVAVAAPVYIPLRITIFSFVHAERWLLVVNLVMLVLVGEVLAHCLSVLAFVRLYSMAAALSAVVYIAACWHTGIETPLCGSHPILMSWCPMNTGAFFPG